MRAPGIVISLWIVLLIAAHPGAAADVTPPAEVRGLLVDDDGVDVNLDWGDVGIDITGQTEDVILYRVYGGADPDYIPTRAETCPGPGTMLLACPADSSLDHTAAFQDDNDYFYLVSAVDDAGNESNTRPSDVTTPPILNAWFMTDAVVLSWSGAEPETAVQSYTIFWSTASGSYDSTAVRTQTTTEITGLVEGTEYFFVVAAADADGNLSEFSNEASGAIGGASPSTWSRTGTPEFGSFQSAGFDILNLENLNVHFAIPIVTRPGRGLDFSHSLTYDSTIYEPIDGAWYPIGSDLVPAIGWNLGTPLGKVSYDSDIEICKKWEDPPGTWIPDGATKSYGNYRYRSPAGTQHEFSVSFTVGSGNCGVTSGSRTGTATDGSGLYLDATDPLNPKVYFSKSRASYVSADEPGAHQIVDRNGNRIHEVQVSGTETHWIDTLGNTALKIIEGADFIDYKYLAEDGMYKPETTIRVNIDEFTVKTNFGCPGVSEFGGTAFLPTSIDLPTGNTYLFEYEEVSGFKTGRLAKVTLPTGGYYQYTYHGPNNGIECSDGTSLGVHRTVHDGSEGNTWQFTRSPTGTGTGTWKTSQIAPQLPYDAGPNFATYEFDEGKEVARRIYQGDESGDLLLTVETSYENDYPDVTITTLDDGQQSKVDTDYDDYGNLLKIQEYGYGAGAPGPILRTTTHDYKDDDADYLALNMRDLVEETIVYRGDTGAAIDSRTVIDYDNTALECITGEAAAQNILTCAVTIRGNPTSITTYADPTDPPAEQVIKTLHYDELGNLRQVDINSRQQREWKYRKAEEYAFPHEIISGTGPQLTTSATYNNYLGAVKTAIDENNEQIEFIYDVFGRVNKVKRTRDQVEILVNTYNDNDHTITGSVPIQGSPGSEDRRNETTHLDGLAQPFKVEITDNAEPSTVYSISETAYDALNRAYRFANPHNNPNPLYEPEHWSERRYDALGRVVMEIPPGGTESSGHARYEYAGNSVTITDPAGYQRKYEHDAMGRLVTVSEPDPNQTLPNLELTTTITYTALDAVEIVTRNAQVRSYTYDGLGRLESEDTPEAGRVEYDPTDFGAVDLRTDKRDPDQDNDDITVDYGYDGLHRLETISYTLPTGVAPTPNITMIYGTDPDQDNNGRLQSVTASGTVSGTYIYDAVGRIDQVDQEVQGVGGGSYSVFYDHNLANQVTRVEYPSGRKVDYLYDTIGRLTEISEGVEPDRTVYVSDIAYNPAGQITGFDYGNGIEADFTYDPERLQLDELTHLKPGETLLKLDYDHGQPGKGNNGQIASIEDKTDPATPNPILSYTYDPLQRLETAQEDVNGVTAWGLQWAYDEYGNRTSQSATAGTPPEMTLQFDNNNQITSPGGYEYDPSGNTVGYTIGADNFTFDFDGEHRLAETYVNGTPVADCVYGVNGLRVKTTAGGITTVYIWAGTQLLAEYDNGNLSKEYIYLGDKVIATFDVDPAPNGTYTYHHHDHLSVRVDTDEDGNKVANNWHYPFGEEGAQYSGKWRFTSYEEDDNTELDYAKFRNYAAWLGRFTTPDPVRGSIGDPQSLNRFAYSRNDPINRIDPLGLDGVCLARDANGNCTDWITFLPNNHYLRLIAASIWRRIDMLEKSARILHSVPDLVARQMSRAEAGQLRAALSEARSQGRAVNAPDLNSNPFHPSKDRYEWAFWELYPHYRADVLESMTFGRSVPTSPWLQDPILRELYVRENLPPVPRGIWLPSIRIFGGHPLNLRFGRIHLTYDLNSEGNLDPLLHVDSIDPTESFWGHLREAGQVFLRKLFGGQ